VIHLIEAGCLLHVANVEVSVSNHRDDVTANTPLGRRQFLTAMAVVAGAVAIPGLAGCTTSSTSPAPSGSGASPVRGGTLRVGLLSGGNVETLDPQKSTQEIDEAVARQLYTTLMWPNADYTAGPYLAESMTSNGDGTQWQVKLRTGATFHNGKSVTSDDVLYTLQRMADPKTASGGASSVAMVDFDRTKKISPTELLIVLKTPKVDFDQSMYLRESSIIPAGTTSFQNAVGSGPFKVKSWQSGKRSEWVRNENFFLPGQPYVDQLEIISIAEVGARMNALLGGQVDIVNYLDGVTAKAQEGNAKVGLLRSSPAHAFPFCMDLTSKEFSDVRVREAMKLAFDRPQLLESAYLGYGQVGNDMFGIGTTLYNNDLPQRTYDPEKAKGLLAAAGVPDFRIDLFLAAAPAAGLAFSQSATAAGITVTTQKVSPDKYFTDIYMKKPLFESDWSGAWNLFAETTMTSTGSYRETNFSDPKFDELLAKANRTVDLAARKAVWNDLQEIAYNTGTYLIPAFVDNLDAVSPKVRGIDPKASYNRLGGYDFKSAWLSS
jgi:peptide/nickel transport system substrate-binding protein